MPVHIGQITSEVRSAAPAPGARSDDEEVTRWEASTRIMATIAAAERRRRRTSTGQGDD